MSQSVSVLLLEIYGSIVMSIPYIPAAVSRLRTWSESGFGHLFDDRNSTSSIKYYHQQLQPPLDVGSCYHFSSTGCALLGCTSLELWGLNRRPRSQRLRNSVQHSRIQIFRPSRRKRVMSTSSSMNYFRTSLEEGCCPQNTMKSM
jgi:hypothetical protein